MAALLVGRELDLVDREEFDRARQRHRLHGAHEVPRAARHELLFAGDERHVLATDARGDAVVHLAREEPQREAEHAALVLEHALDRPVRLAGVGRPEDRVDAAARRHRSHCRFVGDWPP